MRRTIAALLVLFAALLQAACRKHSSAAGPAEVARTDARSLRQAPPIRAVPAPRDDGRLPELATPQHYQLALTVDPAQPRFSGVMTVKVDVPQATYYVVLHARDVTVSHAAAVVGSTEIPATATPRIAAGGVFPEELVLSFARPVPAGPAMIEIVYDAPFAPDLAGLYRVQEQGRYYAYTQFESTDARRAFPCFDEPGYKTPYDVTIAAPAGLIALSNSPEVSSAPRTDGMVLHTFATTPPLPSYLVAFAIGDFDVAEGRKDPFPIRVVTTKGKAHLADTAIDVAAALIDKLGDYFDLRYPYAKLDLVAVPDFAAGAMENPGLVTFRDVLLLLDPQHTTTAARRSQAQVIAHEFAHQWVGDLVTMKWWNDTWLNEGFATWAAAKIVDQWRPSFGAGIDQIAHIQNVMDVDSLRSARAVREPVRSTSDAIEAFDGITYQKGAAVLRMIESWLGPDVFQRGVQRYVRVNAFKNASADDLFASLDYVSTQRVEQLASGFLDHAGAPQVIANWKCDGGSGKLELRQSEWHALGGADLGERELTNGVARTTRRTWMLPVCIEVDGQKSRSCFTLGADPIVRNLGAQTCPAWVYPNAGEAGYYRVLVERDKLLALARASRALSPAERLGLVANAWAGVRQGAIAPGVLFDFLSIFDGETNRFVVDRIIDVLEGIDHALVEDGARAAFQRYALARLAGRKRALGWYPPSGREETDDDRAIERGRVLWALGEEANDEATLAEADKYATAWLRNRSNVSADTAAVAVPLASMRAGEARLRELREAAKAAVTPEDRVVAIRAMGMFDDPDVLKKAFDLALGDELKLSEWRYLFGAAMGHRVARPVLYAWEKENWGKLRERAPNSAARGMIDIAGTMCSTADRDDARSFFEGATRGMEGAKRPLEIAIESAGLCVGLRDHGAADVTQYLKRR